MQGVDPEYSHEARAAGLEGAVSVTLNVGPDGTPVGAHVTSPLGLGLDEKALEAVAKWRFSPLGPPAPSPLTAGLYFLLPLKLSRWHLTAAKFEPPEGASRPIFLTEPYPLGPGVSNKTIDEGWVISAIPRAATVTLHFDIDELGVPTKFQVLDASAETWGDEAIAVVRPWRFTPGANDGKPVSVPCTLDLVWGQKVWTPEILTRVHAFTTLAAIARKSTALAAARSQTPPLSQLPPTVVAAYLIQNDTPRTPYAVIIGVTVGKDGVPTNLRMVRSLGASFDSPALEAIRAWRFDPSPTPVPTLIELDFSPAQ
jgi:TonB family protein